MQFTKILALSAVSGLALANNSTLTTATPKASSGCSFSDYTATASAQVASVAACATVVGDITVQGDAFGTVELTGVKAIYGSLAINNATQAVTLNAPTLQLVSGELSLSGNTILSTLNLAVLTTVGTLNFNALPALTSTGLTTGITSADSVIISDTGLTSLDGINVYKLEVFNLNNNKDIATIDSALESVTDSLSISYNAEKVDVVLNQLTSANDVFFQSVNSLTVSNLTSINGSLTISSSTVDTIEFASLKTIGKSLTISKNDELEELDFPLLVSLGGALQISDNDKLSSISGFPKLKTISGSVTINGTIDNGTFSALQTVSGGFTFSSDGELTCDAFNKLNKNGDILGDKYSCSGAGAASSSSSAKSSSGSSTDSASDSSSTSAGSSSSASATKKAAAAGMDGKVAAAFAGLAAVGVALC